MELLWTPEGFYRIYNDGYVEQIGYVAVHIVVDEEADEEKVRKRLHEILEQWWRNRLT